ncbi:MAG: hypothetical protein LUI87_15685 [Lachnospiraceae bacterium]|nr:hypothetical protein [Lachnospiraceae bacterium]
MKITNVGFNYCVVAMDYQKSNFSRLRDEWRKNGCIMWKLPGSTKVDDIKQKSNMTISKFKEGTVIYFYVTNLPASNQNSVEARILLRGVVCKEPQPMKYEEVYFKSPDFEKDDMIYGFAINHLSTFSASDLQDDSMYNVNELKQNDPAIAEIQGNKFPNSMSMPLSIELISRLEESFCREVDEQAFEQLIDYFSETV